jgi:hypothetical protein
VKPVRATFAVIATLIVDTVQSNIFVRENGEVKIALEPAMNPNPRAPVGAKERSLHRLAPEVNKDDRATSKSDVYAMGHLIVEVRIVGYTNAVGD